MVEETSNSSTKPNKVRNLVLRSDGVQAGHSKAARPKPVYLWSVADVVKWLRRHCSEECGAYADHFVQHEITGLALVRVNENILLRLGVDNSAHRQEILRQIMKLRLKTDIMEIMDLSREAKQC